MALSGTGLLGSTENSGATAGGGGGAYGAMRRTGKVSPLHAAELSQRDNCYLRVSQRGNDHPALLVKIDPGRRKGQAFAFMKLAIDFEQGGAFFGT